MECAILFVSQDCTSINDCSKPVSNWNFIFSLICMFTNFLLNLFVKFTIFLSFFFFFFAFLQCDSLLVLDGLLPCQTQERFGFQSTECSAMEISRDNPQ